MRNHEPENFINKVSKRINKWIKFFKIEGYLLFPPIYFFLYISFA